MFEHTADNPKLEPVNGVGFATHLPRTSEIVTDRPVRSYESKGHARHAKTERSDPHRELKRASAERLAGMLKSGLAAKRYEQLILVAPPVTLGDLREALPKGVQSRVVGELRRISSRRRKAAAPPPAQCAASTACAETRTAHGGAEGGDQEEEKVERLARSARGPLRENVGDDIADLGDGQLRVGHGRMRNDDASGEPLGRRPGTARNRGEARHVGVGGLRRIGRNDVAAGRISANRAALGIRRAIAAPQPGRPAGSRTQPRLRRACHRPFGAGRQRPHLQSLRCNAANTQ